MRPSHRERVTDSDDPRSWCVCCSPASGRGVGLAYQGHGERFSLDVSGLVIITCHLNSNLKFSQCSTQVFPFWE